MKALVAITALGGALFCPCAALAAPRVGAPAPPFVGQTIDGQAFDLGAFKGHVVVANLWATWCPPCRAEMPMLDAFYKAHRDHNVVLIGLSADRHQDAGAVRKVMKAFTYPASLLSDARTNGFGSPRALPQTVVIDREGVVRAVLVNGDRPLTAEALEAQVSPLLAARP